MPSSIPSPFAIVINKVPNKAPEEPPIPDKTFIAIWFRALETGRSLMLGSSSITSFIPRWTLKI